jgi:hypothetical protein
MDRVALARQVLAQVTDEFHKWAREDAARILALVCYGDGSKSTSCSRGSTAQISMNGLVEFKERVSVPASGSTTSGIQIGLSKVDIWDNTSGSTEVLDVPTYYCEEMDPVPAYESWNPLKTNIWKDPSFDELLYVPYADEPTFPAADYVGCFHDIKKLGDPDGTNGSV